MFLINLKYFDFEAVKESLSKKAIIWFGLSLKLSDLENTTRRFRVINYWERLKIFIKSSNKRRTFLTRLEMVRDTRHQTTIEYSIKSYVTIGSRPIFTEHSEC